MAVGMGAASSPPWHWDARGAVRTFPAKATHAAGSLPAELGVAWERQPGEECAWAAESPLETQHCKQGLVPASPQPQGW